jgi:aldose 1-epimerase
MAPERPAVIHYEEIGRTLTLRASAFFTHAVIYTPPAQPYFCVESQSCSTDAHNLHTRGLTAESHLATLKPGESLEAWIELQVETG